jgi:hypothetical protein
MKTSEILAVLVLVFCILLGLAASHNMTSDDIQNQLEWDRVPP